MRFAVCWVAIWYLMGIGWGKQRMIDEDLQEAIRCCFVVFLADSKV
jgi:hypothetical protein